MRAIWKFPLRVDDEQDISMPLGAVILTVQIQNGTPCLWVEVETENVLTQRTIRIYGTGHPMSEGGDSRYIGTFQMRNGSLVFHVFEDATTLRAACTATEESRP